MTAKQKRPRLPPGGAWGLLQYQKRQQPSTTSTVDRILSRLEKVRPAPTGKQGPSWMCLCPAHEDKSPSLRVTDAEDRVLLYCNAGCGGADIVAAIGLTLSDLYHEKLGDHLPPKQRKQFLDARQVLKSLKFEILLVAVAASNVRQGVTLSDEDLVRLWEAETKIRKAAEAV